MTRRRTRSLTSTVIGPLHIAWLRAGSPGPLLHPTRVDRPVSIGAVHVDILQARERAREGDVERNNGRERRRGHRGCADRALAVLQRDGRAGWLALIAHHAIPLELDGPSIPVVNDETGVLRNQRRSEQNRRGGQVG